MSVFPALGVVVCMCACVCVSVHIRPRLLCHILSHRVKRRRFGSPCVHSLAALPSSLMGFIGPGGERTWDPVYLKCAALWAPLNVPLSSVPSIHFGRGRKTKFKNHKQENKNKKPYEPLCLLHRFNCDPCVSPDLK